MILAAAVLGATLAAPAHTNDAICIPWSDKTHEKMIIALVDLQRHDEYLRREGYKPRSLARRRVNASIATIKEILFENPPGPTRCSCRRDEGQH